MVATLTPEIMEKIKELQQNVEKYLPLVKNEHNASIAYSAAKYYPALKELASK